MDGRMLKPLWGLWLLAALLPAQAQEVYYIHTDALGSPVAETDANRNVVARFEYEPYGRRLNASNDDKPGYTGHVMDAVTGLVQMQQRYYDPQIGRTLSVDPVTAYDNGDMRFFNRYAYAFNNPYRFTDPDGRSSVERAIDRDIKDVSAGNISKAEFNDRALARGARGAGGAVGALGVVGGVVAVKAGVIPAVAAAAGKVMAVAESASLAVGTAAAAGQNLALNAATRVVTAVAGAAHQAVTSVVTNPTVTSIAASPASMAVAEDVVNSAAATFAGAHTPSSTPQGLAAGAAAAVIKELPEKLKK